MITDEVSNLSEKDSVPIDQRENIRGNPDFNNDNNNSEVCYAGDNPDFNSIEL